MKKRAIIILLLLGMALSLAACGGADFSIEGKWKNVGSDTFGQVQENSIVVFDGTYCNFYSPKDTYAFYKDGSQYRLDCTSFLFSETLSFTVKVMDKDNIEIKNGNDTLTLKRVG